MMFPPLAKYQRDLAKGDIVADNAQLKVVESLDALYSALTRRHYSYWFRIRKYLAKFLPVSLKPIQGIYCWGGVGRGKTYLMDLFYESVPFKRPFKRRMHFHRFMHEIQQKLTQYQGEKDPLQKVARDFTKDCELLCFDEFFVKDIADAMILAKLLECFFDLGLTLVATSNIEPINLYHNGLQRNKFLPAIALLEKHTKIINLDNGVDYRFRALTEAELYHYPLDGIADENMTRYFKQLAPEAGLVNHILNIEGRAIPTLRVAHSVVWFDAEAIIKGPRSQVDYMEIARSFHTVLISNLTVMTAAHEDVARRFIAMVDEFYDHNVTLILSAEVAPDALYQGELLSFEFERTISRLTEMRSEEYLLREHLA